MTSKGASTLAPGAELSASGRPLCLAFTKTDKVKPTAARARIAAALKLFDVPDNTPVVPFSSVTGEGRRELWAWIQDALSL